MFGHDRQPIAFHRLDADVEEQKPRAIGLLHRKIVRRGSVRQVGCAQHVMPCGRESLASLSNNDDLVTGITGSRSQALDALR